MGYLKIVIVILIISDLAISYQDMDIDGVDDEVDLCLDTPFDEIVDENGCSQNQKKKTYGELTLKIGSDIFEKYKSLNLYANYKYNSWDISISNYHYSQNSITYEDSSYNNIYLEMGYSIDFFENNLRFAIGDEISEDDSKDTNRHQRKREGKKRQNTNSKDNRYYTSLSYTYQYSEKESIFGYYSYHKDYSSLSLGLEYLVTKNWYSGVSFNYIDNSKSIDWSNSYNFTDSIFIDLSYSYTLEKNSYDDIFSLALGFIF